MIDKEPPDTPTGDSAERFFRGKPKEILQKAELLLLYKTAEEIGSLGLAKGIERLDSKRSRSLLGFWFVTPHMSWTRWGIYMRDGELRFGIDIDEKFKLPDEPSLIIEDIPVQDISVERGFPGRFVFDPRGRVINTHTLRVDSQERVQDERYHQVRYCFEFDINGDFQKWREVTKRDEWSDKGFYSLSYRELDLNSLSNEPTPHDIELVGMALYIIKYRLQNIPEEEIPA